MKKKYTAEALEKLLEQAVFYGFFKGNYKQEEISGAKLFINLLKFCEDVDINIQEVLSEGLFFCGRHQIKHGQRFPSCRPIKFIEKQPNKT